MGRDPSRTHEGYMNTATGHGPAAARAPAGMQHQPPTACAPCCSPQKEDQILVARGRPERRRATSRRTGAIARRARRAACPNLCFARGAIVRALRPVGGRRGQRGRSEPRRGISWLASTGSRLAASAYAGLGLPRGRAMLPLLLKSGALDVAAGLATNRQRAESGVEAGLRSMGPRHRRCDLLASLLPRCVC